MPNSPIELKPLIDAQREALETFLEQHLESSLFLSSNLRSAGLRNTGQRYEGIYVGAFQSDILVGVGAHYWNGCIVLQAPTHTQDIVEFLVSQSGQPVVGFLGPYRQVCEAMSALELNSTDLLADVPEILYTVSLQSLAAPDARAGQILTPRAAMPRDLDTLTEWTVDYTVESSHIPKAEIDIGQTRNRLSSNIEEGLILVLEDDGQLLSMASINAQTDRVGQVGGVWTPPHLRSRGYARQLVHYLLRTLRAAGKDRAILFTPETNTPAQKAYESIGFSAVGDYAVFLLSAPKDMSA